VKYLIREATRVQPGRPALLVGLRAALAVAAPMLVASFIGPTVTTWATLGGLGVVTIDKGGAYRTRAIAMFMTAFGGALGVLIGAYTPETIAPGVVAAATGLCAMLATWPGLAGVGSTIALELVLAATLPHSWNHPWLPAVSYLAGGLWTIVLALLLWPVRIYRPARLAAMRCVRAVARHAAEVAARDKDNPAGWREALLGRHRAIRQTLEEARAVLAATRRGRRGEIGRGERLLVIVEAMDPIFGVLLGIEEVLDNLGSKARRAVTGDLRSGLSVAVARLDEIADRLAVEDELPPLPPLEWRPNAARSVAAGLPALARAEVEHVLALVARIHEEVTMVSGVLDTLANEDEPAPPPPPPAVVPVRPISPAALAASAAYAHAHRATVSGALARVQAQPRASTGIPWNEALKSSIDRDSVVLRHALRVAAVSLIAMLLTHALGLARAYWAILSAVLLLQPYLPATITRGVQRVAGTVAGSLLAMAIVAVIHEPIGIAIAAIVFAGVSAAVVQLNYALYALFLTPSFILLAEVHAHDTELVELRIINTLIGAGLAVAGALLLWPTRESARTADRLADALDGFATYLNQVFAAVTVQAPARATPLVQARRRAGRALNHADLSLDRLAAEGTPAGVLESHMAVAALTRRLAATLSAFATARHVADPGEATIVVVSIGTDAERFLRAAAHALRDGTRPPTYQRHDALHAVLPPLLATRLGRIDLQLSSLGEAVARTVASASAA